MNHPLAQSLLWASEAVWRLLLLLVDVSLSQRPQRMLSPRQPLSPSGRVPCPHVLSSLCAPAQASLGHPFLFVSDALFPALPVVSSTPRRACVLLLSFSFLPLPFPSWTWPRSCLLLYWLEVVVSAMKSAEGEDSAVARNACLVAAQIRHKTQRC